jgi:hypothetical protein
MNSGFTHPESSNVACCHKVLLGDTGFEQHAEMPANTHISETRAAECAAPDVPPEFDASQGHLRP